MEKWGSGGSLNQNNVRIVLICLVLIGVTTKSFVKTMYSNHFMLYNLYVAEAATGWVGGLGLCQG